MNPLTLIKVSDINLHEQEAELLELIYNITGLSFDIEKYSVYYQGVIEQGFRITFFETVKPELLEVLHGMFKHVIKNYSCFYIDNEFFSGCIKEYLFGQGCSVGGTWKQALGAVC
jgi:hypothetical protein